MRKSLFGGYPHEGIKSLEVFPHRVPTQIIDNKVVADISPDVWGTALFESESNMKDFLLNRLHDYNNALDIAEKQIVDMDREYPFIPEDFNFKEKEVVDDGLGTPIRFYEKDGFLLTRAGEKWMLRGHETHDSGKMVMTVFNAKLSLPNAQIAFITLRALGVITDEEFEEPAEFIAKESEITESEMAAELEKRKAVGEGEE